MKLKKTQIKAILRVLTLSCSAILIATFLSPEPKGILIGFLMLGCFGAIGLSIWKLDRMEQKEEELNIRRLRWKNLM